MEWLDKNLEAMATLTRGSAERIRAAGIPAGFERAIGTDGTQTFLRTHGGEGGKRLEWLGGTSMPQGGAEGIVATLAAGHSNGLGLSIGTGYEWKAFVRKLGATQALFLYEPDVGAVRMALSICDLSAELESGKIVLVVGEKAGDELAGFLREHLGYEPPTVLHPLASVLGERRNELLKSGEAMVRRAVGERAELVPELMGTFGKSQRQSVVAFVQGERYRGERPVREAIEKLRVAGDAVREVRLDHFGSSSLAMRLRALAESGASRIVGDYSRGQIGCVPDNVSVETWVPPLVGAGYWQAERFAGMGGKDRIVVHGGVHKELLQSVGVAAERVVVMPLVWKAAASQLKPVARNKVAVIGDLPILDMGLLGIELPTHKELFVAARSIIEEEYLAVHFGAAGDVLRRALARAKIAGDDPALADRMLRIIRDLLIPSAPLLALVGKLRDEGFDVELVGEWPGLQESANWSPAWERIAVLVHLSPWGVVSPLVLDAAARGVGIVAPEHPSDSFQGSLPTLSDAIVRVPARQLMATIKRLLKESAGL